jgi:hypothetical protein
VGERVRRPEEIPGDLGRASDALEGNSDLAECSNDPQLDQVEECESEFALDPGKRRGKEPWLLAAEVPGQRKAVALDPPMHCRERDREDVRNLGRRVVADRQLVRFGRGTTLGAGVSSSSVPDRTKV